LFSCSETSKRRVHPSAEETTLKRNKYRIRSRHVDAQGRKAKRLKTGQIQNASCGRKIMLDQRSDVQVRSWQEQENKHCCLSSRSSCTLISLSIYFVRAVHYVPRGFGTLLLFPLLTWSVHVKTTALMVDC